MTKEEQLQIKEQLIKEADIWLKKTTGKFEKLVDRLKAGEEAPFIVLAHDTKPHVDEIFEDKKAMEAYASKHDTKIVYLNMGELFERITKQ